MTISHEGRKLITGLFTASVTVASLHWLIASHKRAKKINPIRDHDRKIVDIKQDLFTFSEAVILLLETRPELEYSLIDSGFTVVEDFYQLLSSVQKFFKLKKETTASSHHYKENKFIIEVEGLDGSGKTSLVTSLSQSMENAIALKTPSASLKNIRPLFDKVGGKVARAFYSISNYVLEYEIETCIDKEVLIIDRWYASTVAYTLSSQTNTTANDSSTSSVPNELLAWPKDLLQPNLLLILDIDPEVRRKRVQRRREEGEGASRFNPWDDLLDKDKNLGERIMDIMKRVRSSSSKTKIDTHMLNANNCQEEVLEEALNVIRRYHIPEIYFSSSPLEWWKWESQKLGLCDEEGYRNHHQLFNLQVAISNRREKAESIAPPILKTVGLYHIDSHCLYYWTSSISFRQYTQTSSCAWASCIWMSGEYPFEKQWRAEGYVIEVTSKECELFQYRPPSSLVAHLSASHNIINVSTEEIFRPDRSISYDESVKVTRQKYVDNTENLSSCVVCLVRFVPVRIEVLRGGPSTRINGFPQRWEWSGHDWTMRNIMPFSHTPSPKWNHKSMTVVLTGCHASGKSTIAQSLAELFGWQLDEELGDILREKDSLVSNGHLHGDGSSLTDDVNRNWDERIFQAEYERDKSSKECCRIVETWHLGNAAWHHLRQRQANHNGATSAKSRYLEQAEKAIKDHKESSIILFVHLTLGSPKILMDRRKQYPCIRDRLPLDDEAADCRDLFECLQDEMLYNTMAKKLNLPILMLDNGTDGQKAIKKNLKKIIAFISKHLKHRVYLS